MKKTFVKNLPSNAFIFGYSAFSLVFYCFLFSLYGYLQQLSYTQESLPVGAIIGIGLYVALKLVLSVSLIKNKGPKSERNISAIVTTDMFFAFFSFFYVSFLFAVSFDPSISDNSFSTELGFFAIAITIIALYNTQLCNMATPTLQEKTSFPPLCCTHKYNAAMFMRMF